MAPEQPDDGVDDDERRQARRRSARSRRSTARDRRARGSARRCPRSGGTRGSRWERSARSRARACRKTSPPGSSRIDVESGRRSGRSRRRPARAAGPCPLPRRTACRPRCGASDAPLAQVVEPDRRELPGPPGDTLPERPRAFGNRQTTSISRSLRRRPCAQDPDVAGWRHGGAPLPWRRPRCPFRGFGAAATGARCQAIAPPQVQHGFVDHAAPRRKGRDHVADGRHVELSRRRSPPRDDPHLVLRRRGRCPRRARAPSPVDHDTEPIRLVPSTPAPGPGPPPGRPRSRGTHRAAARPRLRSGTSGTAGASRDHPRPLARRRSSTGRRPPRR